MVRGIGSGDNPFLRRHDMDIPGSGNSVPKTDDTNAGSQHGIQGPDKSGDTQTVKKPGMEEGAGSANTNANPDAKLDRSQFTNEDDIQEIDLQEFDDELR